MDVIGTLDNDGMGFGFRGPDVILLRASGLVVSVHCSWERTTYAMAEVVPTICEPRLESTLKVEGKIGMFEGELYDWYTNSSVLSKRGNRVTTRSLLS